MGPYIRHSHTANTHNVYWHPPSTHKAMGSDTRGVARYLEIPHDLLVWTMQGFTYYTAF